MSGDSQSLEKDVASVRETLTREMLYALVWSEPMLKVAARYGVSSSYMARVCTRLNVPRPPRGYWAKLEVGKASKVPSLPEPRPGDELVWLPGGGLTVANAPLPKPPDLKSRKRSAQLPNQGEQHPLLIGAKALFEVGRVSRDAGYLKPTKKLLVDIISTKAALDKALTFANLFFFSLEQRGHRVVIAPESEHFHREDMDERERQTKAKLYNDLWSPGRPTVVYIDTVAIGLTVIETCEEVAVRYVNGEYIRESEYVPPKQGRYQFDHTWTTTKDFGTGRLCLQAYSPYRTAKWVRHWREAGARELSTQVAVIVKELEQSAVEVARLVEEGERQAAIERERWEAERARWRKEEAERHAAKALAESKQELFQIINEWAQWQNVERFFAAIKQQLSELDAETRETLCSHLEVARRLLGSGTALDNLKKWKLPGER